ncbi:MAG: hypothetical protein M3P52_04610, partial [Actinomycetota bacterium]|nr:hypothetical protein [Actinomycetota bacterium]
MTEELASQLGAVATRADEESDTVAAEPVFSPLDFRLNLGARLADVADPLPNLDSPAIRKLTWEHVVPGRPTSSVPRVETTVPLPPPPPISATPVEIAGPAIVEHDATEQDAVEQDAVEQAVEDDVVVQDNVAAAAAPIAVVGPEVNRLALVPELIDDDDSPIELPPISSSGPIVAHVPSVYAPVLAETYYLAQLRPVTTTVAAVVADNRPPRRRGSRKP